MHGSFGITAGLLLVAPAALAQTYGGQPPATSQPARAQPLPVEVAAQASFDTTYLLATCMRQLAQAGGSAPSPAEIDEAARQYFTNGAAATGVPTTGPGAAYFRNGASVTGVPTSGPGAAYFRDGAELFAYYPPPGSPMSGVDAGGVAVAPDSGVAPVTPPPPPPPVAPPQSAAATTDVGAPHDGGSLDAGPTCSPRELEAAMAIAKQFAAASVSAAAPPPPVCPPQQGMPSPGPPPPSPAAARAANGAPARTSAALAPVVSAFGGAVFGGVAVALWGRRKRR
ncbi:MAG: hypothetical protein ACRENE_03560 [Polyangiaceae bacterium]